MPAGEFEPRYVDVPRRRRAQLAAERNLKWGLAVLLLALGLIGAAIIVSGPRALVPIVICLVTLTILWAMARLRVFHQRNGVFFATAMVCLLGAAVPMVERAYVELDRMAHAPASDSVAAPALSAVDQKAAQQKTPEPPPVAAFEPDVDVPSLVEAMKIPEPTDPNLDLVRIVESTKVMVGRKPYMLNSGDIFVLEQVKDGQVFFRAKEMRLFVPERAAELMAAAPAGPAVATDSESEMPRSIDPPPPAQVRASDRDIDGGTTARAQSEAVRRFPALGEKGSVENALFVEEFQKLKRERPEFFDDEEWPLYLAETIAKEHGWARQK